MDQTEYDRRIDKIRKCLRLGKSANANEAAAAMRHAQAMMSQLGLSEEDIGLERTTGEAIITKEAFGGSAYLRELVMLIKYAFSVEAVYEEGNGISRVRANVRYIGPHSRVVMACHAHKVIDRAISKAWKEVRDIFDQQPGARYNFRSQFIDDIFDKVSAIGWTPTEQKAATKWKEGKYGPGGLVKAKSRAINAENDFAATLGGLAAGKFDINRPLDAGKRRLGHD